MYIFSFTCEVLPTNKMSHNIDMEICPEMAMNLFQTGCFVILENFPKGSEFGIDYKSWTVGPKFFRHENDSTWYPFFVHEHE